MALACFPTQKVHSTVDDNVATLDDMKEHAKVTNEIEELQARFCLRGAPHPAAIHTGLPEAPTDGCA